MKKALIIILSLVIVIGLAASIFMFVFKDDSSAPSENSNVNQNSSSTTSSTSTSDSSSNSTIGSDVISLSDVEANDGLNGNPCWVAVDSEVYFVPEGAKGWANGQHTKSGGQVKCGMDTGTVITSSPHGEDVLKDLDKIGTLQ
jgi:predicted heme/steroid binding protein